MKYKKKLAKLAGKIKWYEAQSKQYQTANKKPGGIK